MCRFWSVAFGYVEEPPPAGYLSWEDFLRANDITIPPPGSIGAIVDPDGVGPRILFIRVPERKMVKNRLHFDLRGGKSDEAREAKITELAEAGATHDPAGRGERSVVDGDGRPGRQRVLCHVTSNH